MINSLVDKIFLITTLNSSRFDYISNHLKENNINCELFIATNYKLFSNDTFTGILELKIPGLIILTVPDP